LTKHPKKIAKRLKTVLDELGYAARLSLCQETVARMFAYRDWYELHRTAFDAHDPDEKLAPDHYDPDQLYKQYWRSSSLPVSMGPMLTALSKRRDHSASSNMSRN
jgi:hypothetical protein